MFQFLHALATTCYDVPSALPHQHLNPLWQTVLQCHVPSEPSSIVLRALRAQGSRRGRRWMVRQEIYNNGPVVAILLLKTGASGDAISTTANTRTHQNCSSVRGRRTSTSPPIPTTTRQESSQPLLPNKQTYLLSEHHPRLGLRHRIGAGRVAQVEIKQGARMRCGKGRGKQGQRERDERAGICCWGHPAQKEPLEAVTQGPGRGATTAQQLPSLCRNACSPFDQQRPR